jgi:RimJ/RimL family protein N-acetyltransferase
VTEHPLWEYIRTYKALTSRQNSDLAMQAWMKAGVPAAEAAQWANLNYHPGECAHLRAQGITPMMAEAMEQAETEVADGPDALVLDRVAELLSSGMLIVDPSRVETYTDPEGPDREIITIWPEMVTMTSTDPRFASTVGRYIDSPELAAELDGAVRDLPGKSWFVVLADNGAAAGFCGAVDTGDTIEVETFWMRPAARGRGIGTRVLCAVIAAYPDRRLHAWCSASSRSLFERTGFQTVAQARPDEPVWWAEVQHDPV